MRRVLPTVLLALAGLGLMLAIVPGEQEQVRRTLADFPQADPLSHRLRPWVLAAMCFLPALGAAAHAACGTLDRYLSRQFLAILAITFGALTVVWLLIDLQDNLEDMKRGGDLASIAARFYAARFPEVVVTLLPFSLLLALLFTLGRLSNHREIVAMLQGGRGIFRITAPFLAVGVIAALFCIGFNFHWAPRASAEEKRILDEARGLDETAAEFVHFRNPREPRLWMVGAFPPDFQRGAPLDRVRIVEENEAGALRRILTADTARWSPEDGTWSFAEPVLNQIRRGEPPVFAKNLPDPLVIADWRETPAEIIQPGLPAGQLGIPGLVSWLKANPPGAPVRRTVHRTQWHYRWAQPVQCLVLVLLATPLGVVFTRRAASGGVAVAVLLCAGMLFLTSLSLNFGEAGHLPPALAAWLPNLLFGGLAFYLFHRRLSGQPIYQVLRRLIPNAG